MPSGIESPHRANSPARVNRRWIARGTLLLLPDSRLFSTCSSNRFCRHRPSGNGVQRELIAVNSTLTLVMRPPDPQSIHPGCPQVPQLGRTAAGGKWRRPSACPRSGQATRQPTYGSPAAASNTRARWRVPSRPAPRSGCPVCRLQHNQSAGADDGLTIRLAPVEPRDAPNPAGLIARTIPSCGGLSTATADRQRQAGPWTGRGRIGIVAPAVAAREPTTVLKWLRSNIWAPIS